jgi:hypothetical protein
MKIKQSDFDDTRRIADWVKTIDDIDADYVDRVSAEMFKKQSFFLAVLIGYRLDTSVQELEEIRKIYFLIWQYFKDNPGVQTKPIIEEDFEKSELRNIAMLHYVEGESSESQKKEIFERDLQPISSKALLAAILFRFDTRPVLRRMDERKRGIIFLGIKSFIICFEDITFPSFRTPYP